MGWYIWPRKLSRPNECLHLRNSHKPCVTFTYSIPCISNHRNLYIPAAFTKVLLWDSSITTEIFALIPHIGPESTWPSHPLMAPGTGGLCVGAWLWRWVCWLGQWVSRSVWRGLDFLYGPHEEESALTTRAHFLEVKAHIKLSFVAIRLQLWRVLVPFFPIRVQGITIFSAKIPLKNRAQSFMWRSSFLQKHCRRMPLLHEDSTIFQPIERQRERSNRSKLLMGIVPYVCLRSGLCSRNCHQLNSTSNSIAH